ncbi:MAG: squalene synthase HpnC [Calditrichaeota bacterium]|nr:squalene synthase HpnC [Calditrichota bacterium]
MPPDRALDARLKYEGLLANRAMTLRHYENFKVASLFLPKPQRRDLYNIYAFARSADDIADEPHLTGSRSRRLDAVEYQLRSAASQSASEPLFAALGETIRRYNLPLEPFLQLLNAFRLDLVKTRYADWSELERYATDSANPVGRLVLMVCGQTADHFFALSDKICTALQFANHWQDVAGDYRRGRIYIPQSLLQEFSVQEADIAQQRFKPQFRGLMSHLVEKTENLFREGKPLLNMVSRQLKPQLFLYWGGGIAALEAIRRVDYDVLHHSARIGSFRKLRLALQAGGIKWL